MKPSSGDNGYQGQMLSTHHFILNGITTIQNGASDTTEIHT